MTDVVVFGLPNCDTCRKAQKWLTAQGVAYTFCDLRNPPVTAAQIGGWLEHLSPEQLVNRRSTTWRGLSEAQREQALAGDAQLLEQHPTLIKRPLAEWGNRITVGFQAEQWEANLS
ncbi:MAG: Spx/MgsR family RNA polymerase-binding regulatory protein [Pseudomonadota bacterium]